MAEKFGLLEVRVFLVESVASDGKYTDRHYDNLMHQTLPFESSPYPHVVSSINFNVIPCSSILMW
jgi:hypothetical protein